jgi:hypothetical protein
VFTTYLINDPGKEGKIYYMLTAKAKLNMSFTVGSLLAKETLLLVDLYVKNQDWTKAKKETIEKNILQAAKISSCQRIVTELYSRLKLLNKEEIDVLTDGTSLDRLHILWLAFCRKYQFAHNFASEVIRNKIHNYNYQLDDSDFNLFFDAKELIYPELEKIPEKRKNKLRQVLFRSLREANLIDQNQKIKAFLPSSTLITTLNKNDLVIFPLIN